jgi:4-amino-4-deoxy-L-arabinose transferase-like glycosyltransferase
MGFRLSCLKVSKEEVILISLVLIIFLFKSFSVHPTFSDENLYFLMGKKVDEGLTPYVDFSYVHPPLQIYTYALFFRLFGVSLSTAKLAPLISSCLSVILIFVISKKLFEKKTAFFAGIFFLLTPMFLAFSDQGYGMWESLVFLLLSFYFALGNKITSSAILFTISLFFRYLILTYLPFLLILIFFRKGNPRKFLFAFILFSLIVFLSAYMFFGDNFIRDTILFQINARFASTRPKMVFQYFNFGFFTLFLCATSAFIAFLERDKQLMLFSLYPIFVDIFLFISFKNIAYHYFLLSLPFAMIAVARAFSTSKETVLKLFIVLVFILVFYTNLTTLDFYINPKNSENIYQVKQWIQNRILPGEKIFGEYSITSYISFSSNIPVAANRFDTYLDYLKFVGEDKIINELGKEKPRFVIDLEDHLISSFHFNEFIQKNYRLNKAFSGVPVYLVYEKR